MDTQHWEYKVAFVEGWQRVSVEGAETYPEAGERHSGFGRRFLNTMGADGWELVDIQLTMPHRAYYIFKRPLAAGAEPDLSVVRREHSGHSSHAAPESEKGGEGSAGSDT